MVTLGSLILVWDMDHLSVVKIIGMQFLDFFDFLTNSVMMPIAALMTCLLVSKVVGIQRIEEEVMQGESSFRRRKDIYCDDQIFMPDLCSYYIIKFRCKCIWLDFDVKNEGEQGR